MVAIHSKAVRLLSNPMLPNAAKIIRTIIPTQKRMIT
jgi:hypothetical protein